MRKSGMFILFVLHAFSSFAQDSALIFKVRDPEMKVSVIPADSILWTEQANPIHIRIKGEKKLGGVFAKGARLIGSDSSYVLYVTDKDQTALLTIYEILPDGAKAVCFTKKYTIKKCAQPIIKICGVVKDSVLDLWDFHIRNNITAYLKDQKKYIPIVSFQMVCARSTGNDTLFSYGNKFNLTMREELFRMKPGSTLTICNIEVLLPGGKKKVMPPVQVFLAETGKRKVG